MESDSHVDDHAVTAGWEERLWAGVNCSLPGYIVLLATTELPLSSFTSYFLL